jgi:hypothetical protein
VIRIERTIDEKYTIPFKIFRQRLGIRSGSLRIEVRVAGKPAETRDPWQWDEQSNKSVVVIHRRSIETVTRRNR